ncbi:MAG: hypothetical protein ACPG6R_09755 [Aequoribacter sp.]|uniref:hypothetical protein n=1 Tax=Aequoribacter sp. TaxID=2847771 RepID=UPI003C5C52E9
MTEAPPIKLRIPRAELSSCSLFDVTPAAAAKWAEDLPLTNAKLMSRGLLKATWELNRIDMPADQRLAILNSLRRPVHTALNSLATHFLNQPLSLPAEAREMFELADNLAKQVTTGYTLVAVQAIQQRGRFQSGSPAKTTCEGLHRAISIAGRRFLQTLQLYKPIERGSWLELYQLYLLCDRQQLSDIKVTDELDGSCSVKARFTQICLLGSCRPNQLRQKDLPVVYRQFYEQRELCHLLPATSGEGLLIIDLGSDSAPVYNTEPENTSELGAQHRYLFIEPLTTRFKEHINYIRHRPAKSIVENHKEPMLSTDVLEHLVSSLGQVNIRGFSRTQVAGTMHIVVGLASVHFHIAGERIFERVLQEGPSSESKHTSDVAAFLHRSDTDQNARETAETEDQSVTDEISDDAYSQERSRTARIAPDDDLSGAELSRRYPKHRVRVINSSTGGYCLEWSSALPRSVKTGDVVGLCEEGTKDWVIATIRWVSQLENAKTLIGVSLLSPSAFAFGAQTIKKLGEVSDPVRVLLLPEISLTGTPQTLITPRLGFKEFQKISLIQGNQSHYAQLQRQVSSTPSYSQFAFRYMQQLKDVMADEHGILDKNPFNAVWHYL